MARRGQRLVGQQAFNRRGQLVRVVRIDEQARRAHHLRKRGVGPDVLVGLCTERSIDMLQNDSPDYGGYRVKAIDALQSARKELAAALEFRAHESRSSEVMTESDENLRFARLYVERSNDMLSHDQRDYGGHRVTAMNDLSQARSDLNSALKFDKNHEDAVLPTSAMPGDEDLEAFFVRGQFASNENIEYVRRYAERAIDLLQNDSHDYHGFRAKAIDDLQRARDQLVEALRFR